MKGKETTIVTVLALFCFLFMSIGYAMYGANATVTGQAKFIKNGKTSITSAILSDYKNLENPENPQVDGNRISFDLNFNVARTEEALNDQYYATYTITITNDSFLDYTFETGNFVPSLNTSNNEDISVSYKMEGIEPNEVIPSKEAKTFTLTITMIPNNVGNFNVSGDTEFNGDENQETGSLIGTIPKNITGSLKNNNDRMEITASIINSYENDKNYNIKINSNKFELVDENDNALQTYTIGANQEQETKFYIKLKEDARFAVETQSINIFFEPEDGTQTSMGVVTIEVSKDTTIVDVTPPTISSVEASFQAAKGNVLVSYQANDNVQIDHFTIEAYKVTDGVGTLYSTNTATGDTTNYTVTNLEDGDYYFKVIAEDTSGLTTEKQTDTSNYLWTMPITISISGGSPNGNYTVDYGQPYTVNITANNNRAVPSSLTVKMNDVTLGENDYSYTVRNGTGTFSINSVTGKLDISGETTDSTCLIKGTKIKLANGKEKNIEDIKYDDLLLVWNYETGKVTKEYPLWIEKPKSTTTYTRITFSDKSYINIYGDHAFFSYDKEKFVQSTNTEDFHIGTNILKLTKSNKLKKVKVTNIETSEEETTYYFVASTRYYNVISNDFITTDRYTDITNLYPFDNNITWKNTSKMKILDYKYLEDVLPYYLYKGFRAGEVAVLLANNKTNLEEFKKYIKTSIISENMLQEPIMKENDRYWAVTTDTGKDKKLVKEGDYITLPKKKNIKYWYSTSENKKYKPGEKVQVWTGMHFESVK